MILRRCAVALALCVLAGVGLTAQTRLTGTIAGKVIDSAGLPVPGVTVTVTGPALMNPVAVVTNDDGQYRAVNLPPGTYGVKAELQGFRVTSREDVVLSLGMDLDINFTLSPANVAESITVVADSPVVDIRQTKNTQTITKDALATIPLARNVISVAQLAPGVVERTVMGSARNDTAYLIDGSNVNAPDQGYVEANLVWDTVEEVEFITTSSPAETYGVIGGALNIVTKSGGNRFSGVGQYYYTNEDLNFTILPSQVISTLNIGQPSVPLYQRDASVTIGGPIQRNRVWFLGAYRNVGEEIKGGFRPATILGKQYDNYNSPYTQNWAFGKVTAQLNDTMRFFTSYNYTKGDRPNEFSVPFNRTLEATRHWQANEHTLASNFTWTIGSNTYLDARGGFWRFDYDGLAQPGTENNPAYTDRFTSYTFGRLAQPDATSKRNYNGSVKISRYVDDLAGSHEMKAGLELQYGYGSFIFYSPNSLRWDVYNDDVYYYRGLFGLNAPHPTFGDGRLQFSTAATEKGGSLSAGETMRYGFFLQDSWRVAPKLTLNLGLRYDTTSAYVPGSTKAPSDPLSIAVGQAVLGTQYGINPYGAFEFPEWDVPLPWKGFSPQVGAVYDVFGSGKTAVKAQWARYQERMPTWHFTGSSPAGNRAYTFNWFDLNGNRQPDNPGVDRYEQTDTANPLDLLSDTWKEGIDPNLKTPFLEEFTLGVDQQLPHAMRLSVMYVHRARKNLASNPRYDLATGEFWHTADSPYWVPFATTVPAVGTEFPAVPVTVYFQKVNSPAEFRRLTNIPEAKATYDGVTFAVTRRMQDGWQLGASLVLSKNQGNYVLNSGSLYGLFGDPNYYINRDGREPFDRPTQVKLWGSVTLPYEVVTSFFYTFASGVPWARTTTVLPPAAWAAANGTRTTGVSVLLEPTGERREQAITDLSMRVEKQFVLPNAHRVGVFVDAFNVLGFSIVNVQANPAGNWRPADVNTTAGTFAPSFTGPTGQTGLRTIRLSLRYSF